jgi:hypothetical protein
MDTKKVESFVFNGTVDGVGFGFKVEGCSTESEARVKLIGQLEKLVEQLRIDEAKIDEPKN